ncbi:hypothetical protein EDD18DRAFT_1110023 [Armillaria luteobubalina]|uniref:Uncharacterized protein n=1 Tax=Armillaria luteobubalina TaxID=153913 RepID=A0AA39THV9_9AGAR|nr:hypothetical protein EDD18DRAFT_1110023 [Armillaria luteobubalina]
MIKGKEIHAWGMSRRWASGEEYVLLRDNKIDGGAGQREPPRSIREGAQPALKSRNAVHQENGLGWGDNATWKWGERASERGFVLPDLTIVSSSFCAYTPGTLRRSGIPQRVWREILQVQTLSSRLCPESRDTNARRDPKRFDYQEQRDEGALPVYGDVPLRRGAPA